jgi:hypothetical protein
MFRAWPLILAAVVLAASGVVQGLMTDRWGLSPDLEAAAARLNKLPDKLGHWESRPLEIDQQSLKVAEIAGYVARRYLNSDNSNEVSVFIVCGRSGPIARHEPDVCYRGVGYEPGKKHRFEPKAGGGADHFWRAVFTRLNASPPDAMRISWAWSTGGDWVAPENSHFAFVKANLLYKVYVVRQLSRPDEPAEGDPAGGFLGLLLPELRKIVNPDS